MNKRDQRDVIMLAAGGTGGHIFPAQALAELLEEKNYRAVLVTDQRSAAYPVRFKKDDLFFIPCRSMVGGIFKKIIACFHNARGYLKARSLINELNPIAVVGFGGYPSFPTMFAAVHMNKSTCLHEQNAVLGRVNRLLAPKVDHIATAFSKVRHIKDQDRVKLVCVGNPIRKEVESLEAFPYPDIGKDEHFHLLVTGGSQGARIFGEVIPEAIKALPKELRAKLRVDQQCREEDIEKVKTIYKDAGVDVDLAPFFNDIAGRMANAHLVVARSGAGTVCELAIAGKPSILIPLASAMDNHQFDNASILSDNGGAIRVEQHNFTVSEMAKILQTLLSSPNTLVSMAKKTKMQAQHNAADKLAALLLDQPITEEMNHVKH